MTTFENELRKIFADDALFGDTVFVGRSCYGKLTDSIRVRAEFITLGYADHYEALKVSLINKNEGVIDSTVLRFKEIWGKKAVSNPNFKDGIFPHMWKYRDLDWYVYQPTTDDFKKLSNAVAQYLDTFR